MEGTFSLSISVDGHLACFRCLAAVNNAALNTSVQTPVPVPALGPLGYIPRSGTAWSYGNDMFHVSRNCQKLSHGTEALAL